MELTPEMQSLLLSSTGLYLAAGKSVAVACFTAESAARELDSIIQRATPAIGLHSKGKYWAKFNNGARVECFPPASDKGRGVDLVIWDEAHEVQP